MICSKRGLIVGLALLFLGAAVGIFVGLRNSPKPSFKLPDGSVVSLAGVTYGTNAFVEANLVERLLRKLIPAGGITLRGKRLERPRVMRPPRHFYGTAPITAWIEVKRDSINQMEIDSEFRNWRVIASNRSGRQLENPPGIPYRIETNRVLVAISLTAFPRNDDEILLRVLPPVRGRAKYAIPEFRIRHPRVIVGKQWKPEPLPLTNRTDSVEVILEKVGIVPDIYRRAPDGRIARLQFRLVAAGKSNPDWQVAQSVIMDEEGNIPGFWPSLNPGNKGLTWVDMNYFLEENKTWRIVATIVRTAQFPSDEIFNLRLGSTNELRLTNSAGKVFFCRWDGRKLQAGEPDGSNERPYITLLGATDSDGSTVRIDRPSWLGRVRCLEWAVTGGSTALDVQLALPKVIKMDFYVQPSVERVKAK